MSGQQVEEELPVGEPVSASCVAMWCSRRRANSSSATCGAARWRGAESARGPGVGLALHQVSLGAALNRAQPISSSSRPVNTTMGSSTENAVNSAQGVQAV